MIGIGISPSLLNYKLGGFLLDSFEGDARAIFSIRRLLTSYTGALVRLRRDSDHAESDFGPDVNGDLDTAAITTWLGGANGFVKIWYDQSGNGYDAAASATKSYQPQYIAIGINSKPVFRNNPSCSSDRLVVPDEAFRSLAAGTILAGCEHNADSNGAIFGLFDADTPEKGFYVYSPISDGRLRMVFGSGAASKASTVVDYTDPHIIVVKGSNGALCHMYVDGTELNYGGGDQNNATTTIASFTRDGAIGQNDSVMTYHDGNVDNAEIILLASALSDADRNAIEADQSTYFNI